MLGALETTSAAVVWCATSGVELISLRLVGRPLRLRSRQSIFGRWLLCRDGDGAQRQQRRNQWEGLHSHRDLRIDQDLLGVDGWALTWPASGYTYAVPSCWSQDENVTATSSVTKDELTLRKQDLALDVTVELCSKLGWSEPPRARLETEQGRRFASIA